MIDYEIPLAFSPHSLIKEICSSSPFVVFVGPFGLYSE